MACSPTRSSLLTSRYQIHTGLQHSVIEECQPLALEPEAGPTIAEAFKQLGYSTAMYGKWHLGYYREAVCPWRRGFDEFVGFLSSAEDHFNHSIIGTCPADVDAGPGWQCGAHLGRACLRATDCSSGLDLRRSPPTEGSSTADLTAERHEYSTRLYSRLTVERIEKHADAVRAEQTAGKRAGKTGLFVYYSPNAVHVPLEAPAEWIARFPHIEAADRRVYAAMLGVVDEGIGNISVALHRTGLYASSVIVTSTDNGGVFEHAGASNFPLRGGKATLFEGGLRGVAFLHSPLLLLGGAGRVYRGLMGVVDWAPTLLHIATNGDDALVSRLLPDSDGVSHWAAIASNSSDYPRTELLHNIDPLGALKPGSPRPPVVVESGSAPPPAPSAERYARAAIRVGEWKLLVGFAGIPGDANVARVGWAPAPYSPPVPPMPPPPPPPSYCRVRTSSTEGTNIFLFNVVDDPNERCDLSLAHPEMVAMLMARLDEHNRSAVPARFPPSEPELATPCAHEVGGQAMWGPWH